MNRIRPVLLVLVAMLVFQRSADAERLSLKHGFTRPFYAPALNVQWTVSDYVVRFQNTGEATFVTKRSNRRKLGLEIRFTAARSINEGR